MLVRWLSGICRAVPCPTIQQAGVLPRIYSRGLQAVFEYRWYVRCYRWRDFLSVVEDAYGMAVTWSHVAPRGGHVSRSTTGGREAGCGWSPLLTLSVIAITLLTLSAIAINLLTLIVIVVTLLGGLSNNA